MDDDEIQQLIDLNVSALPDLFTLREIINAHVIINLLLANNFPAFQGLCMKIELILAVGEVRVQK
jgi:hypothetical protein